MMSVFISFEKGINHYSFQDSVKFAHNIQMRVFCREKDNELDIINAIHELFPFDFEKQKIEFTEQTAETFEGKKIKIFSVFVKKQRHTAKVLNNLFSKLSDDQKELLRKQMESRLDQNLHFFIRLDKPKLLEGEYWITDSGDCFHLDICIAAYPHKRAVARTILKRLLE